MSWNRMIGRLTVLMLTALLAAACANGAPVASTDQSIDQTPTEPTDRETLTVVATTNIIADVVGRVGGDGVTVTSLIPVGADPHSFNPTPRDLAALADAHAIFANGLDLEETMAPFLANVEDQTPVIVVNDGIDTLAFTDEEHDDAKEHGDEEHGDEEHGDEEHGDEAHEEDDEVDHDDADAHEDDDHDHDHGGTDPHTWFDVANVAHWVQVIEQTLTELDPDNAGLYAANSAAYLAELDALAAELDALIAQLPAADRKLITDHDSLGYFAHRYDFDIIGTVVPSLSTLAAPSAQQLAALQDQIQAENARALFVGSTVNPDMATQLGNDRGIPVIVIYTGSLSDQDGPAATYLDFMRYNTQAIVQALQ